MEAESERSNMKQNRIIYQVWYETEKDQQSADIKTFYFLKQAQNFVKKNDKILNCQIEALRQYHYKDIGWQIVQHKIYAWDNSNASGTNMNGLMRKHNKVNKEEENDKIR